MSLIKNKLRNQLLYHKIKTTELFDPKWYIKSNGLSEKIDPYYHYLAGGWKQSDPSQRFSNTRYLEANLDIRDQGICPLEHYLLYGKKEHRQMFLGQVPGRRWRFAASRSTNVGWDNFSSIESELQIVDQPLVTVIIPSYNREESIQSACQSVLSQTYQNIEVIVVDDCSTDRTGEIIQSMNEPRVRYIRHNQNMGACVARNTGIKAAHGEYIAFQDSDDIWLPKKLEIQMRAIRMSDCDVCFCGYEYQENGQVRSVAPLYYYDQGIQKELKTVFCIGTQTLLAKRAVLMDHLFDPSMPRFQDLELLVRLAKKYQFYFCDIPLVRYKVDGESISKSVDRLIQACDLLLSKHPEIRKDYPLMAREIACLLLSSTKSETQTEKKKQLIKWALIYDHSWTMMKETVRLIRGHLDE